MMLFAVLISMFPKKLPPRQKNKEKSGVDNGGMTMTMSDVDLVNNNIDNNNKIDNNVSSNGNILKPKVEKENLPALKGRLYVLISNYNRDRYLGIR